MYLPNDLFCIDEYPSEKPCDIFEGDVAYQLAVSFGMPDIKVLLDCLREADSDTSLKTRFNPAVGICRWDALVGYIGRDTQDDWDYGKVNGQPCITSKTNKIRIIFMSGNEFVGNVGGVLSSNYPKGKQTKNYILANEADYRDSSQMRTWILYYPSLKDECYHVDDVSIKIELAYPKAFILFKNGEILPSNHQCRLIFEDSDSQFKYKAPTSPEMSFEITEEDFNFKAS